tara:strand:- start:1080 stop:1241 length:162 start_codon:yes stop_codon:yes gene_type:complete
MNYFKLLLRKARKDVKRKERDNVVSGCIKALSQYPPQIAIKMLDEISKPILNR